MPVRKDTKILSHTTPNMDDLLFMEVGVDLSLAKYEDLRYGVPHHDQVRWKGWFLVGIDYTPEHGDKAATLTYAAERKDEEKYAWEHAKADLGGNRYDTITRAYLVLRKNYDPTSPILGTAMNNVPENKFSDYASYILVARQQTRIAERAKRGQTTIGESSLDSMFVVELRTYAKRSTITAEKYDPSTNGPLYTTQTFYCRGEVYDSDADPQVTIEQAVTTASYWVPSDAGQVSEFQQVSSDVWVVTTQDLIPQGTTLPDADAKFGGTHLRTFETSINYSWPSVLGDDGNGYDSFDITQWADKQGGLRYYSRPVFKRSGFRGPCKAVIHEEWLSEAQMAAARAAGSFAVLTLMEPEPIHYVSPFLSLNIPPCLHGAVYLQADTGTTDVTWGQNVNTRRDFAATNYTDWPASIIVEVNATPARGGYLVRHVTCFQPQTYSA